MLRISRTAFGIAAVAVLAFNGTASAGHLPPPCGATITADTTLDSDIVCAGGGPAIRIGADAVTLDLNGHTIDHGSAATPAIENMGFDGVTIANGQVITDTSHGILLNDADRGTLRALEVIRVGGGDLDGTPVVLTRSDDVVVEGNALYGWTGALRSLESHRGVIRLNRTGYFRCPYEGDCATRATGGGVTLLASDDNRIEDNWLSQGISGVSSGSNRNVFMRNSVTFSIGTGLVLSGGADNVAVENTATRNGFNGIGASGARIERNEVFDNVGSGIAASGAGTLVSNNVAYRNRDDGIHVFSAGVTVARNRANDNRDLGIEAVAGVVDGHGNKASGNGNPAQCVNVVCK